MYWIYCTTAVVAFKENSSISYKILPDSLMYPQLEMTFYSWMVSQ